MIPYLDNHYCYMMSPFIGRGKSWEKQHREIIPLIIKKNMSLGYINLPNTKKELQQKQFQIEVAKIKYNATLRLTALHDPENILIRH